MCENVFLNIELQMIINLHEGCLKTWDHSSISKIWFRRLIFHSALKNKKAKLCIKFYWISSALIQFLFYTIFKTFIFKTLFSYNRKVNGQFSELPGHVCPLRHQMQAEIRNNRVKKKWYIGTRWSRSKQQDSDFRCSAVDSSVFRIPLVG